MQLLRRLPENIFGGFLLRVGFDVDFPEIFVQLRQGHLDGRLHRVDVHRRQLRPRLPPRHGELVGEHEFHQLRQDAVLGTENILEGAVGNVGFFNDLRQRRTFVALFQKEPNTDSENPFFRGQTCACNGHRGHSSYWMVYIPSVYHAPLRIAIPFLAQIGETFPEMES